MNTDMSFWYSNDLTIWEEKLSQYWHYVDSHKNSALEHKMAGIKPNKIKTYKPEEFYEFLHYEYFPWIFLDSRWLNSNIEHLEIYKNNPNGMNILKNIHSEIFGFDINNVKEGLKIAIKIHGLGYTGGSGLLALLYPEHFGTINNGVIEALQNISGISLDVARIKHGSPSLKNGILVIETLKNKASELNNANNTTEWTPRKIDMALWITRDKNYV